MELGWLREIAACADDLYAPFVDRSSGKERLIERPQRVLLKTQRRIYRKLLRSHSFSTFSKGGVPGRSLMEAVKPHVGQRIVVTADIRQCYPSISDHQVFTAWRNYGCGEKVAGLLTRLTTHRNHLPQGAPTSLAILNLLLDPIDVQIAADVRLRYPDVHYTRWVDDLIFSGEFDPADVYGIVANRLGQLGLRLHRSKEKRRIMRQGSRQEILGAVINVRPSISRKRRSLTRAIVHRFNKGECRLAVARGHLEYLKTFHTSLADQLRDSLRLAPLFFKKLRRPSS